EELSAEYNGEVKIGKLDVDSNQETAIKYGVRSIPTVLFFKGGQLADTIIGAVPKNQFEQKIKSLI
ncbi:MAG TPA: thioredoxin domain-containing protein, partial [Ignavibacteriales bacterium]|nr:thioredoxin domain-containing protein [Ignavibacteriales bacterium]